MKKSTLESLFVSDKDTVDIPMGYNAKGEEVIFTIRESGTPPHEKSQRRHSKELERSRRDDALHRKVLCKIIAESILISWKGVTDEKGKPIEPTYENKFEALFKMPKMFYTVMEEATKDSNFKIDSGDYDAEADTEKN